VRIAATLLILAAVLAACAEPPARPVADTPPSGAGSAPSVTVGGTMRGFYGYSR
jgi:hypothetical protein